MGKIKYELFGEDAEVIEFITDNSSLLTLDFSQPLDGLISIDGIVSRVNQGRCVFDTRFIDPGKYLPTLILKDRTVRLPEIVKAYGKVGLLGCSDDYTRGVSIRERRLSLRVEALEKKLKALESQITKTIL